MPDVIVPKIKVQIATSELGSDNNDIKVSTSFELKIYGSNIEQNTVMNNLKALIVAHNEKIQGVQQLPLESGSREEDEDFPSSRKSKTVKAKSKTRAHQTA